MSKEKDVASLILSMERIALDRWGKGDPSGFLEISGPDVVYFDPFLERRLDGFKALTDHYEKIRGQIQIDRDEMLQPQGPGLRRSGCSDIQLCVVYGRNPNALELH